jgi:hypothetical protein
LCGKFSQRLRVFLWEHRPFGFAQGSLFRPVKTVRKNLGL